MAIYDFTSSVKNLQKILGIDHWQVATCDFTVKDINTKVEDTITFLDLSGNLTSLGFDLNLSSLPLGQSIADAFNDASSLPFYNKTDDEKGDTFLTRSQDTFRNQLMVYDLPNNQPIIQYWGTDSTEFKITTILSGNGHIDKLSKLRQILTTNLGETGGQLTHHLHGSFSKVFVQSFGIVASSQAYNAVIVEINFITPSIKPDAPIKATVASQINNYVNDALNALSLIASIGTIEEQLETLFPTLFDPSSSTYIGAGSNIIQIQSTGTYSAKGNTTNLVKTNPELSSAINQLNSKNIPLTYDPVFNSQLIIEQACQYGKLIVQGYGQGGLSQTSSEQLDVIDPNDYVSSSTEDSSGNITEIQYQVRSQNDDGTYTIDKITTVTTAVSTPTDVSSLIAEVNNLVTVGGVMNKLYPELYYTYTTLIASLEQLVETIFKSGSQKEYVLLKDMLPAQVASLFDMTLKEFFDLNSQLLVGHRKLKKGMSVLVNTGSIS